jgi:hypothetical protein
MMFGRPGGTSHLRETIKGIEKTAFKDRQMHLSNGSSQPIYVMVTPSMGYAFANALTSTAKQAVSARDGSPPSAVGAVKNLNDFQQLANMLALMRLNHQVATSDGGVQTQVYLNEMKQYLKENATTLAVGETKQLLKVNTANPIKYLSLDTWTALFNSDALSLFIATEDMTKLVFLDSGADDSWIFRGEEVVRAKYGTLWQDDPGAGKVYVSKGDRLPSGASLKPGDSLTSQNRKYVFVYQHDGNAVVYDVRQVGKHVPIWASNTGGNTASALELFHKGEVVLWSEQGKKLWSDPRSSSEKETFFSGSFLVMADDGILRVVGDHKQVGWSSRWKYEDRNSETWPPG